MSTSISSEVFTAIDGERKAPAHTTAIFLMGQNGFAKKLHLEKKLPEMKRKTPASTGVCPFSGQLALCGSVVATVCPSAET